MEQTLKYKEWIGEIPLNTLRHWEDSLMVQLKWEPKGWSGEAKEPYRHWGATPNLEETLLLEIWDTINYSIKEEGLDLKPERVLANLYSHGDSSWLHKDSLNSKDWTVILYLNTHWDINWGGETVIIENNEIEKAFAPTPGKFILFKSSLLHGPRAISREAPYPRFGLTYQCVNRNNV